MGSLKERITSWLGRKSDNIFRYGTSTLVGGKWVMMEDNPRTYINKGLVYNPDVASIIEYITKVAIRVPWVVKKGDEVLEDHDIEKIWKKGNPVSRGPHIFATAIKQYLATGNTFLRAIGPENGINAGKKTEFWNLHYDLLVERGDTIQPIKGYRDRELDRFYPVEEVLHWKTANPDGNGYFGTSPLKAGRLVLDQSNQAYEANAKSLRNLGARGILTREDLAVGGEEQAKKLQADFERKTAGADKFGKLVIAGGKYDYLNFALSPTDLQLLDAQMRSRQALCNIYGFPSELMNDKEASTYNNLSTMMRKLYTDVEIPLLEDFADLLHDFWVVKWGDGLTFRPDWSGIEVLQDNKKELTEWLDRAWWIPAERKAEIMGEEQTITGHYIPANYIPEGMPDVSTEEALKAYGMEKG
jgi:HK97 family phage portal protein